jgi:hypothetical protein
VDGEAFGVLINKGSNCLVERNVFQLVRKNAIRHKGSGPHTITRNHIRACWSGIAVNDLAQDGYIHNNYVYHASGYGAPIKRFIRGDGWYRVQYNTFEDCADNALSMCQNRASTNELSDRMNVSRNLLKMPAGSNFVLFDFDNAGPDWVFDHNMYWKANGGPTNDWEAQGEGGYKTLAEVQTDIGFELNGLYYDAATVDEYGASDYEPWPADMPLYVPYTATVYDASSNTTDAPNTVAWRRDLTWTADTDANEWIVYDLGATQQIDVFTHVPNAHDAGYTPKAFVIATSDSPTGGWTQRVTGNIDYGGAATNWTLGSSVYARYVRFWIDSTQDGSDARFSEFEVGYFA